MINNKDLKKIFEGIDLSKIENPKIKNIWIFRISNKVPIFQVAFSDNKELKRVTMEDDFRGATIQGLPLLTVVDIWTKFNEPEFKGRDKPKYFQGYQYRVIYREMPFSYPDELKIYLLNLIKFMFNFPKRYFEYNRYPIYIKERVACIIKVEFDDTEEGAFEKAKYYSRLSWLIASCFFSKYVDILVKKFMYWDGDVTVFRKFENCCLEIVNGNLFIDCTPLTANY